MASLIDNNSNVCTMEEEIEAEARVLREIQTKLSETMDTGKTAPPTEEEQKAIDSRSVFVGNVDYGATPEELEQHFKGCGEIVRTTIPKDKLTKKQKNHAFIEFESAASVANAMVMNGSTFRERQIVVTSKRTNKPGMGATRGRGGGFRGGRGGQRTVVVKYVYVNGAPPRGRGGFRGGRGRFNPY
ncbi:hypothetical protein GCK72_004266 [Caenorhabditis remanei]|uniref:RRM domain-containing protein n=1 Tax=Caenorhabditis remanei TaxID=31234 RepID=A0A6A5HB93_CAERE|nr:hypothetical protein GCK72_004266 [Caenorhabditis remanei]KAF1764319.1 hypothetical protein GCK72_004266 [Caenorhabditis remanei]